MQGNSLKINRLNSVVLFAVVLSALPISALSLRGIVIDSLQNRQGGAIIELYEPKQGALIYSIEADAAGYFEFQNVTEMDYHIKVTTPTYPPQWVSRFGNTVYRQYRTRIGMAVIPDTLFVPVVANPVDNPPDNALTVTLVDSAGGAIVNQSGLYVALYRSEDYFEMIGKNSGTGSATMVFDSLQAGRYAVLVRSPNYPQQYYHPEGNTSQPKYFLDIGGGQKTTQTMKMAATTAGGGGFRGICRSANDEPLSGVTVSVCQTADTFRVVYSQTTGSDGLFVFSNIMESNFYLKFAGAGYPTQWYSPSRLETTRYPESSIWSLHAPNDTMLIRLSTSPVENPASGSLSIGVMDSTGKLGTATGSVVVIDSKTGVVYTPGIDSMRNRFLAVNIPAGQYYIKLTFPPYPTQYFSPAGNTLTPTQFINVTMSSNLYFEATLQKNPGQSGTTTTAYGTIKGSVKDSTGSPLGDVMVMVYDRNFMLVRNTGTTMDGLFYLAGIAAGPIFIGMKSPQYQLQFWSSAGMTYTQSTAASIPLSTGDTLMVNATLRRSTSTTQPTDTTRPGTGGCIVRGKVTDIATGLPLQRVRIVLADNMPTSGVNPRNYWSPWVTYTDSTGNFILLNVPTGSYRAMAEADSLNYIAQFYIKSDAAMNAKVFSLTTVTSMTLDFSLRKGGVVRGSVVNSAGEAVVGANVNLTDNGSRFFTATTGSDGIYTITAVPGGIWNLWVNHSEYLMADNTIKREVRVTEGSSMSVPAISMERGGRISGTFTSPLPLNDTAFQKNMYQGSLQLYSDTMRYSGSTAWPSATTSIRFEPSASSGYSGVFRSDAIKPGNYRMVFTPFSGSGTDSLTSASLSAPRQGFGYSFVGTGTTFGTASMIRLSANDTLGGQVLTLRKGWTLPGRLKDETGTMMGANSRVEVFVKQDSLFVLVGSAPVTTNGRFELAGLIENEEYYLLLGAPGYPSQYWAVNGNTAGPTSPYRFTVGSFQPLECTIRRVVAGIDSMKGGSSPVSLWIKDDSLGQPLLAWSFDTKLAIDNFIVYRTDRSGSVLPLHTVTRSTAPTYLYRDIGTAANFRDYIVVAKGAGVTIRSNRTGFDSRNGTAAASVLWLDVNNDRWGIQLEWGGFKTGVLTNQDSVNVYRSTGSEAPKLLYRVSAQQTTTSDYKWSSADSGKTFTYYIELPAKQLVSPRVSKTLDATFFAGMGRKLTVGPYEKYQRISDAISAANDFDNIEVRAGVYSENINLAGKNIAINGSWDYGKPPVIDGGGSVAITIPYCRNGREWDRPRISGFAIRNSSTGIKAQSAIDVEECLFDNVTVALSMTIDSAAMVQQILVNPFRSNTLDGWLRHCTFIAKKPGSMIAAVTAAGVAEQTGYTGQYAGREQFYINPAVSLSASVNVERGIVAFYQSSGMQASLPVSIQGKTSRILFRRCNFWKTATVVGAAGSGLVDSAIMKDPQFTDSSFYFIGATSPLAGTTYETRIGYDMRTLNSNGSSTSGGIRPSIVKKVTAATVGLTAVLIRWDAAPATENVKRYRIYRAPGDPALYYIDQRSQWNLKVAQDSVSKIVDSFSTDKPIFLDTTVVAGKAYLYVVASVNGDGNESDISIPAPPDIAAYFVNNPVERIALAAGKWQMIGVQGALPVSMNADSRHALFDWDGSRISDKTLANYGRVYELQATKGYWFKPAVDTVLTMSTASFEGLRQIASTAAVRLIKGTNGWNLVASPFPFAVTPEWLGTYAAWEWNTDSLGYRKAQLLRPWKAYWIYTDRDTTLQLLKKQPLDYYTTRPLAKKASEAAQWQLSLTLQNGQSWDSDNIIGLLPEAFAKSKQLASPEPPAPFEGARLYIVNQQAETAGESQLARLAQLYKTAAKPGAKLEWMIGIGASSTSSTLSINGIADLPENLYAFWVEEGRVVNLREKAAIGIAAHTMETYGYIVVTATPGDLALYTGKLALLTPFPNPFVGSATISYVLPYAWSKGEANNSSNLPLTLKLYSITGKLVTTLVNERRAPGVYRTIWNGENSGGSQVAAGMYLMKLVYGKSVRVARLYRMR